jgi:predicted  nucleic acid-binding Zn-ribbon protein
MQEPESTEISSIDEKNLPSDILNSLQDILDKAQSDSKKIDEIVSSILKLSEAATNSESSIQTVLSGVKEKGSELTEYVKLIESLQTELQKKKDEISSISTQALAISTQISDTQAVIAAKSDHIQKAQEHADKVRSDIDRALTAANQQVTEAEGLKTTIQTANTSTNELFDQIKKIKVLIEADAEKISALCTASEKNSATSKNLADISSEVENRIAAYEKKLAELEVQSTEQLAEIVKLLPGATSAGLATSFDQRRQSFLKPQNRWQWLFIGSVIAIIVIALQGLWHIYDSKTLTYEDIIRLWLARIPVGGALIWLAMHSSRESALAKRLEEDYGYKAAIAASFMGFHKQLNEIGQAAASNEPLSKLCEDTLKTIASPPGRIYDKHKLTISPTSEITQVVKDTAEVINKH